MSLHRRAARRDAAERPIIDALEAHGRVVQQLSIQGGPDLLVGWGGVNFLLEVKTGKKKLNEGQDTWRRRWQGRPVEVVRTPRQALAATQGPGADDEETTK